MDARTFLGAGLLLACGAALAARCPDEVRVSLPNFEIAPYVLGTDEVQSPPGLLIEWTRKALTLAGCKARIVIKRRPPNRQMKELELGLLDVLPGFAFSGNPDDPLVFPMKAGAANLDRALMSDAVSLYVRADDQRVHWNGKRLLSPNPRVGTSTGGVLTKLIARDNGWELETAATPQEDLRKLIAGRIDVIMEPDVILGAYLVRADALAVRKLSPPAHTTHRFAPVSKQFAAAYPEFTERFWLELCRQSRASQPGARPCR